MKKRLIALCALLAAACSPDLMDENSVLENNRTEARMVVDVRLNGTLVSTRSTADDDEMNVAAYNLYIFDVATGELQHCTEGIVPEGRERVAGTDYYRIGTREVTLPTAGQKEIFIVANPGARTTLPAVVSAADATAERPATQTAEFREGVAETILSGKAPAAPFVMTGYTFIASAADAAVPVNLGRTSAKVSLANTLPARIRIGEIAVKGATAKYLPFTEKVEAAETTDCAGVAVPAAGNEPSVLYLLPADAAQATIVATGTLDGAAFICETVLDSRLYADYDYRMEYKVKGGEVVAVLASGFGGGSGAGDIEVSGEWLSDRNTVTLPFTPEPYYGFTIDYVLNVDGTPTVEKQGDEAWYDAAIVSDGKIRIRTLQENGGGERSASFSIRVGGASLAVKVIQQGVADIKTVRFGDLEWMDRNIGATLRANAAYADDIRSFGYLYQWGRNVPFPVTGEVETRAGQLTPAEALADPKFIVYAEGTQDWNANGIEGSSTDFWESVSASPCPKGYRLPTYEEMATVMLYRNNSLVFANGKQSAAEQLPGGVKLPYLGYGSGAVKEAGTVMNHFGVKNHGTADACYMRYTWTNTGGELTSAPPTYTATHSKDTGTYPTGGRNTVRIDRIKADASATYASQKAAKEFWAEHDGDPDMETLVFPCGGRRDASGAAVETRNAAFYWSRSMFSGGDNPYSKTGSVYASGLLYFRPAARYVFLYAPAIGTAQVHANTEDLGYRNQAMQVRCVKEK